MSSGWGRSRSYRRESGGVPLVVERTLMVLVLLPGCQLARPRARCGARHRSPAGSPSRGLGHCDRLRVGPARSSGCRCEAIPWPDHRADPYDERHEPRSRRIPEPSVLHFERRRRCVPDPSDRIGRLAASASCPVRHCHSRTTRGHVRDRAWRSAIGFPRRYSNCCLYVSAAALSAAFGSAGSSSSATRAVPVPRRQSFAVALAPRWARRASPGQSTSARGINSELRQGALDPSRARIRHR
jgi:hypothetical protein